MNAFAADDDMNMNMNVGDEAEEDIPTSLREVMNRAAMDDAMVMHDHILPSVPPGNTGTITGAGTGGTNSTSSNRPARLSDMFAPPLHLIHTAGGFMGARNVAKDTRRWLLVNLNSDADFACHALNRDVWRDELCENLIREGFVFWQTVSVIGQCAYWYMIFILVFLEGIDLTFQTIQSSIHTYIHACINNK